MLWQYDESYCINSCCVADIAGARSLLQSDGLEQSGVNDTQILLLCICVLGLLAHRGKEGGRRVFTKLKASADAVLAKQVDRGPLFRD